MIRACICTRKIRTYPYVSIPPPFFFIIVVVVAVVYFYTKYSNEIFKKRTFGKKEKQLQLQLLGGDGSSGSFDSSCEKQ